MLGQLLDGRYQIVRPLGSGGFGKTYLAQDIKRPGNPVCVVKHLQPASSDTAFLEVARRLFQSEAETLEKLGNHDQIPRLLAYFEQNREFYLVQEYVDGHPLSAELSPQYKWTQEQVIALLYQVLPILAYIHSQGVIHRDIKPDNLLRQDADQKLVLVDFGSVKQVRSQTLMQANPGATVVVGTPGYMPMEQSLGQPRPGSDLYALGMIAVQALTGILPRELNFDADGEVIWRPYATVRPGLAAILDKLVRQRWSDRYTAAGDVLRDLSQLSMGSVSASPALTSEETIVQLVRPAPPTPPTPAGPPPQADPVHPMGNRMSGPLVWMGMGLGFAISAGLGWLLVNWLIPFSPTPTPTVSPVVVESPTPIPTPTETPTVTPTPEITPPPSPSPAPETPTPGGTATVAPEDFISAYYDAINRGDYDAAWAMQTPNFQEVGSSGYSSFLEWWRDTVQSVTVQEVTVVANDGYRARVRLVPTYTLRSGKVSQDQPLFLELVWNSSINNWQIDGSSRS